MPVKDHKLHIFNDIRLHTFRACVYKRMRILHNHFYDFVHSTLRSQLLRSPSVVIEFIVGTESGYNFRLIFQVAT